MWLSGILLVVLALARADGRDTFGNFVSRTENELHQNNIDLRGLGDFFSKIFGPKDRSSGGNNGGGNGGPPGGNNGGGNGGPPGGNNGGGNGGPPGIEKILGMLKGIAEKLGAGAVLEGEGSSRGPMTPGMSPMGMLQSQPWMARMEVDLQPLPFRVPPYLPAVGQSPVIYDKIVFDHAGPMIREELRIAIQQGLPPKEIIRVIAPIVYRLRAGCTTNVLQRLVSAGLTRWVSRRMDAVASNLTRAAPEEDVNSLVGAIKREVIGEVNRTIFGSEFQEFDEMLNFMLMAVRWNLKANWTNGTTEAATNQTTEATSEAIPLLQYLLQCETRQSFLQELLTRIATLKRRVLFSPPWAFTVRILRTLFPCGYMEQMPNRQEMVSKIFKGTSYALRIIQKELGKMVWNVERAIIFGDDTEVAKIFPLFLGNQTGILMQTLQRIRNADGPPPVFPSPPPMPSGPDSSKKRTMNNKPPGNGAGGNGTREDGSRPAGNGSRDDDASRPAGNGTRDDASPHQPPANSTSEKLLNLLKRLLA